MTFHTNGDASLRGLHRAWWMLVLASSLLLALGVALLGRVWSTIEALRWAALTAAVVGVQLVLVRRNLRQNHRPGDDTLLAGLGPANAITLARGLAVAAFAGFVAAPLPLTGALAWAPAILYTASTLPDFIDGAVARATNRVTVLGGILDMEYDSLAMLAVSLLAVRLGKVPGWYISLGLARYLFVAGIWWRERRGLPIHDLTPSNTRRLAAGFQMGYFCVTLWPVFGPPATALAGVLFVTPILAGFVRDWLIVSGRVSPLSPGYRRFERWRGWAGVWPPPVLRWIGALAAGMFLLPALSQWPLVAALAAAGAVSLALGIGARVGAIGLLLATYAAVALVGFQPYDAALMVATIPLLYLGAGRFALWRGEDALFAHRLVAEPGERPGEQNGSS
jgi:CDP-diacylglycerol---glycerol-3-phosphate 3-phosphatidyltransferase